MALTKLQHIAEEKRLSDKNKNIYQNESGKRYTASHPNATVEQGGIDDPENAKGKATGVKFDFTNGGSAIDQNGVAGVPFSGRAAVLQNNYNKNNTYLDYYNSL